MASSTRSYLSTLWGSGNARPTPPPGAREKYEAYIENLRLSKGQALSPVHQVFCPLIEKLSCDPILGRDTGVQQFLEEFKAGKFVTFEEDAEEFARQIKITSTARDEEFKALHAMALKAKADYGAYCKKYYEAFHDVLGQYYHFRFGTSFGTFMWRWYKGRSYRGKFTTDMLDRDLIKLDFIKLIDQVSLLDRDGATAYKLLEALEPHHGSFDYDAQSDFLNALYSRLLQFQKGFFYERALEDQRELRRLRKYFDITQGSHLDDELTKYYYFIVYNKKPLGEKNPPPPVPRLNSLDQLIFDVHQTRDQRAAEKQDFTTRIKTFKQNIHHVAQGLGLPSRLRKTSELFDEFLAAQDESLTNILRREERLQALKDKYSGNLHLGTFAALIDQCYTYIVDCGSDGSKINDTEIIAAIAKRYENYKDNAVVIQRNIDAFLAELDEIAKQTAAIKHLHKKMTNRLNNNYSPPAYEYKEDVEDFASITEEDKRALDQAFEANAQQLATRLRIEKEHHEKWADDKRIARIKFELETIYHYEYDLARCKHIISKDQKEKRNQQQWNASISSKTAKVTSVGEACIAASQIATAIVIGSPLVVLLAVLYCAYYINNLLFRGDSRSVLDALLLKKKVMVDGVEKEYRLIYLDSDGKPLSSKAIWGIRILGSLSFATGVIYGALSFLSSYVTLPKLFSQIGISGLVHSHGWSMFLTILQFGGSAIPAVGMAIAITCIFYKVIADFIREKRLDSIINYFTVNFLLINGNEKSAFRSMDGWQKTKHIAKCAGRVFILACAVAVTVAVTVLSAACFYKDTLKILNFAAHWDPMASFARAMVWINGFISSPFQVEGPNRVFQPAAGFKFSESANQELEKEDELARQTEVPNENCQLVQVEKLSSTPKTDSPSSTVIATGSGTPSSFSDEISNSTTSNSSASLVLDDTIDSKEEKASLYDQLSPLVSSKIGYVHVQDAKQLYYIDKDKKICAPVDMTPEQLTKFDAECKKNLTKTGPAQPLTLAPNSRALNKVIAITGHTPAGSLSPMQKDAQKILYIKKFEAAVTSAGNGIGYAYATIGVGISDPVKSGAGVAAGAGYSGFPNYNAAVNAAEKEFFASSLFSVEKPLDEKGDITAEPPRWRTSLAAR